MPEWLNPKLAYEGLLDFFAQGGWVLIPIMFVAFFMWAFIMERLSYYLFMHKSLMTRLRAEWTARPDKRSWRSRAIRDELVSQVKIHTDKNVGIVQALVAVAPLLGLLGTVTGMINVFDVMALSGSSSARLMAGGVFQATIPTMAGMVVALTGMTFSTWLPKISIRETSKFADTLEMGD